jgi:hypothetical protein
MISVITPCHDLSWLRRAYASIQAQESCDEPWEWVVLANGSVTAQQVREHLCCAQDPRVKVYELQERFRCIAQVKREACRLALGDIHLELDHDDELLPACVRRVSETFHEHPDAAMVYSDCGARQEDGTLFVFAKEKGWTYRLEHGDPVPDAPQLLPQNLCRAQFAPDHVRAWSAEHYWRIGGHSESWQVTDDIDLTCRLYCSGPVIHIPEALYRYHMHGRNTWVTKSDALGEELGRIYATHAEEVMATHAARQGLPMIKLTGADDPRWVSAGDADLTGEWPFGESSVAAFRCLRCPASWFHQAWRSLMPGGIFVVQMPSDDVPKAIGTFETIFHPLFEQRTAPGTSVLHMAALKEGYQPYRN